MPLYNLPNLSGGIDNAIIGTMQEVTSFSIGILLMVFLTVLIGGASRQKRRYGVADVPFWSVLASLSTLMVALLMSIKAGIIPLEVLAVVIAITIFSGLWFFLNRNRNEIY